MSMACFSRDPHPHIAPLTKITAADTLAGLRERPAPLPFGRSPAFRGSPQARSSAGERCPDAAEVSGSIPGAPTICPVAFSATFQASQKLPISVRIPKWFPHCQQRHVSSQTPPRSPHRSSTGSFFPQEDFARKATPVRAGTPGGILFARKTSSRTRVQGTCRVG